MNNDIINIEENKQKKLQHNYETKRCESNYHTLT